MVAASMKTYPSRLTTFDLGKWGSVQFKEWLFGIDMPPITESFVDRMASLIPPSSFAIDIGAFTGDTTLPMALATGRDGLVLAFEPGPASFDFLLENLALNSLPQVTCAPNAVMRSAGEYVFHYTDSGYINGGFSASLDITPAGCGNLHPWHVHGIHLTDYLAKHYSAWIPKLSFIKIDTEGYDREILKANAALIRKHRPTIQVEVYPFLSDRERADLFAAIAALDYTHDGGEAAEHSRKPLPFDIVCKPK